MAYSFEIRQEAIKEFTHAYLWYEEQQTGLGNLFKTKLYDKLYQICRNPFHYKVSYKKFHEALTDTFPFLIIYYIEEKKEKIIILAVFHTSRKPKNKFKK